MLNINIDKLKKLDNSTNEAYKRLRTNVQFCGSDVKVIALTSTVPNEGKSSVSFNLAASIAESGKKVIFLDADLRKSVLVGRYKINKAVKGLTHYLSGVNPFDEVVYSTNVDNLHVVFSGPVPPNPAELLGNKYFKSLIAQLRRTYDYIIIDTPPIGSVIDAAVVAEECDGVILVISAGEISYKLVQTTKMQMEKSNCKILGAVLNKVPMGKGGYYGKYYGKYYGNYGGYGDYGNTPSSK
ncbi:MAG: polysaccharide biosynthesis tyrosine autokinase [Lachnospiraceae bacterium]|nr:polysaccharide biosynthesis tyrosine autokinase [Lachnospiraceae bacterium]